MSKPTDEQLDRECALLCGWKVEKEMEETSAFDPAGRWNGAYYESLQEMWYSPHRNPDFPDDDGFNDCGPPSYTTDRNALPELLDALEKHNLCYDYYRNLISITGAKHVPVDWSRVVLIVKAAPRQHIEAVLKATGRWNPEWSKQS